MPKTRGTSKNKSSAGRIAYLESRKPFIPEYGKIYEHINGGRYECIDASPSEKRARFRNVKTMLTKTALGIGIYEDGRIDWEHTVYNTF